MKIIAAKDYAGISNETAIIIKNQIVAKPDSVIGFATGESPASTYKKLIAMYKEKLISFKDVISFNLDEYLGVPKNNPHSYSYYMRDLLFKHVDIKEENIHSLDGMSEDVICECLSYERRIKEVGGIDLQILGIGRNGHIGFNEPGESYNARTHLAYLDKITVKDNAKYFTTTAKMPTKALSMGIETIMDSKKILLLASGSEKAEAIYKTVCGEISPACPASILRLHPKVTLVLDLESMVLVKKLRSKFNIWKEETKEPVLMEMEN